MTNYTTVFEKVLGVINGKRNRIIQKVVDKYELNYGTQSFFGEHHIKLLMFAQLAECESLEDILTKAKSNEKIKKVMNIPSKSQLSRQNENRNAKFARELYQNVLGLVRREMPRKEYDKLNSELRKMNIEIMDSTVTTIARNLAKNLHYYKKLSGMRMNTIYNWNNGLPDKVRITPQKEGELRKDNTDMLLDLEKGIVLFDRGYCKYKLYDDLTNKKSRFVSRITSEKIYEVVSSKEIKYEDIIDTEIEEVENNEITDQIVRLGRERYKAKHKYRLIIFRNKKNEEIRIITNMYRTPAKIVIELYKLRWEIEVFFKEIKQNLVIKHWYSHNENGMQIQIYMALICYLLVRLLAKRKNKNYLEMKRIVQINLLEEERKIGILSG